MADPFDGCDVKKYKVRVSGLFVVVRRGDCGFAEKALAAQAAGAAGLVVVNTNGPTSAMMADDAQTLEIKIPSYMVSSGFAEDLVELEKLREIDPSHSNLKLGVLGRFIFEDFYGNYDI